MKKMSKKKRVLSLLGYIVFLALLFEGSARLAFLIPQISDRLTIGNNDYTWRSKWVERHQKSGVKIYYKFDNYDATKGWLSRPDIRNMKIFGNKTLNTNAKGFRGKIDYPYAKNTDRVRILILGDSFTFGDEVSDDETYPHYLQEMLPGCEIINLGVHGYGHDQMLILLKEEGVRYKPDIVILGYLTMDMYRNILAFRDFAKPKFVLDGGRLRLTDTPVPRPEDILKWDWARPRILDMLAILRYDIGMRTGSLEREKQAVTTAILQDMITVIEGIHAVPILAYIPAGDEIFTAPAISRDEAYMFSMCRSNNTAECLSTRPFFTKELAKKETFKTVGHWGPEGNHVIAEALKQYLIDKGHVPVP